MCHSSNCIDTNSNYRFELVVRECKQSVNHHNGYNFVLGHKSRDMEIHFESDWCRLSVVCGKRIAETFYL